MLQQGDGKTRREGELNPSKMIAKTQKNTPLEETGPSEYSVFRGIYRATVHITDRCNLSCSYCGFDSGGGERAEIPYETLQEILPVLDRHNVRHLDLSGGEVTTRKDLFDILSLAEETHMSLGLISNGTLITSLYAERLARHDIYSVKISLDGFEGEHDKLRGKGNYKRAMEGIRNLIGNGIKTKVLLTLTAYNGKDLGKLAKNLADMGMWKLAVRECDTNGRSDSSYIPTEKNVTDAYRQLLELKDVLPENFIEWSFINPFPKERVWANNPYLMLEESGRHVTITSKGDVMVSYCNFCADGSGEGNLFREDLDQLITSIIMRM